MMAAVAVPNNFAEQVRDCGIVPDVPIVPTFEGFLGGASRQSE